MTLATRASEAQSSEVKARAEASFKKEERAKDGAKAMMEYQTNSRVIREKMARLKALRLAKEASDGEAAAANPPAPKITAKTRRGKL
jgi:aspartate carbamoyltransferase catalytic subunit